MDVRYLIVGEGAERGRLETLAAQLEIGDRVYFLGEVNDETKWALYQLCDLFVMPNRLLSGNEWEGFGIVFLEAAFAGKPSIGGNNGGVPDAILHEKTGLLIDPEKSGELTSALNRLLSDELLRSNMGKAAQVRVLEEFQWNRNISEFAVQQGWIAAGKSDQ
jgi:phosphatidylinositol alpha-1,6-mannosyltransferase